MIRGTIQGRGLAQPPFTEPQYRALIHLTASLCRVFPRIRCDYPRDGDGRLVPRKLDGDTLRNYQGLLGHFHVQANKVDPGPAFDWERVVNGARRLMR
jgi:N-acetyl-anhydromuramyl-L-alanine amidase AmpD